MFLTDGRLGTTPSRRPARGRCRAGRAASPPSRPGRTPAPSRGRRCRRARARWRGRTGTCRGSGRSTRPRSGRRRTRSARSARAWPRCRRRSRPASWRRHRPGDAERPQRRRAGDAVDGQAVGALEAAHGTAGHRTEGAVGRHAERALEGDDGAAGGAGLERAPPVPAAAVVPPGPSAATAAPATRVMAASRALAPPRPTRFRRACRAASARRRREARSDASQGLAFAGSKLAQLPPGLGAYGVSCRARAKTCATPRSGGDSPREPSRLQSGPPFPASGRRGFGVSLLSSRKDRHISPRSAARSGQLASTSGQG